MGAARVARKPPFSAAELAGDIRLMGAHEERVRRKTRRRRLAAHFGICFRRIATPYQCHATLL